MAVRMLYVLPMLLGRTYDIKKDVVGVDIFSPKTVSTARVVEEPYYRSVYKMVTSSKEVQDFFDVSGELALKVKSGKISLKGAGAYLKDVSSLENTVQILARATFQTVTVSLPYTATPVPLWTQREKSDLGTHYVRSVTYGGELIASVKFRATQSKDLEDIRGEVSAGLQGGSAFDLVASGKLEMLQKNLEGRANMEISYYGTVPLEEVPTTVDGLRQLVLGFRDQVTRVNNGWGVPISVDLVELATLDQSTFQKLTNRLMDSEVEEFQENLNELQTVNSGLQEWTRTLPSLPDDQENEIDKLNRRVQTVLAVFYDVISKLDADNPEQLEIARAAYEEDDPFGLPGKFLRDFRDLKERLAVPELKEDIGTSTYIRWGRRTCNAPGTTTLYPGYPAAAANRLSEDGRPLAGGGANYLCLPEKPTWGSEVTGEDAVVVGLRYVTLDEEPFGPISSRVNGRGAVCAVCHATNRTSAVPLFGRSRCPQQWTAEYNGFAMSSQNTGPRGQFVCVDRRPVANSRSTSVREDHGLHPVTTMAGTLPSATYPDSSFLPCVVCTK